MKPKKVLSAIEQLQRYEDRRVLRLLKKTSNVSMEITIQPCIFGHALIATTYSDRLVAVELGESLDDLVKNFVNRWSKTTGTYSSHRFFVEKGKPDPQLVQRVLNAINDGVVDHNIIQKMSLSGTSLQRQVLESLLAIDPGSVETYHQVASRVNAPKAVRAVANAIGANPIAVIVPCHRVVRSDGKIGGYRWGEKIKRSLLDRERITT